MRDTFGDWHGAVRHEGPGPGVLVLHPEWGLTDCSRHVCDRWAAADFNVAARDLFGGAIAGSWDEPRRMRALQLSSDRWLAIAPAAAQLRRATGRSRPAYPLRQLLESVGTTRTATRRGDGAE